MKKLPTLYLLADGTQALPGDCEPDADGVLRHIYGMPVATHEDGSPVTVGGAAKDSGNIQAVEAGKVAAAEAEAITEAAKADTKENATEAVEPTKELTPEAPKKTYKTREAKAGAQK